MSADGAGEAGRIAAFFDVDHTLIDVNSGAKWLGYMWRTGQVSLREAVVSLGWLLRYRLALLDLEAVTAIAAKTYRGVSVATIEAAVREWFAREIAGRVCVEGRSKVAEHLAQGHVVALLTAGTRFSATPLAELLGVEHVLCTDMEANAGGTLTGKHLAPACAGPGKVVHAERFAALHGIDLARSYFYTDSFSDLPMLERVGQPRVINPDRRLQRRASVRGWPVERWRSPQPEKRARGGPNERAEASETGEQPERKDRQ
jgi:HAD superfamily hydrolase (TIGR01490 family)